MGLHATRTSGLGSSLVLVGIAASLLSFSAGATLNGVRSSPTQPLNQSALRVMTFNVRVQTDSDGDNNWPARRDIVGSTIRFHQADIIGVQEAYRDMIGDLEQRLPGFGWIGVGTSDGDAEGAFNPIFWRQSRLELLRWETLWLSETPGKPGVGWDAAFPRTATCAAFRDIASGKTIHVFNTHFDHVGTEARLHSAELLAVHVSVLPDDAHVVVLGDFNCNGASDPVRALLRGTRLSNARDVSLHGHHGPSGSFTGFAGPQYSGPALDHIFVRGLEVQQHGTLPDHFDGRLPSDHFPVLAELLLK